MVAERTMLTGTPRVQSHDTLSPKYPGREPLLDLDATGFPLQEVGVVVERAVLQAADGKGPADGRLNEEVFWFAKQVRVWRLVP